jgi:hypothetical protein
LFIIISAYLAWGLYRLRTAAWWVATGLTALMPVSAMITFMRVDIKEMHRLMGYSQEQIAQMEQFGAFNSDMMVWLSGVFAVAFLAYMVWIKRFFNKPAQVS